MTERSLSSELIYDGKILKLEKHEVLLDNGSKSTREVISHNGAAAVVPVYEGKVMLVKQYRFPVSQTSLEIPAGKLDDNEDPLDAAKRELLEETGCVADDFELLTVFYSSPGFTNEKIYIYLASIKELRKANPDEDELIESQEYDFEEVVSKVISGEIKDGKTIAGILLAKERVLRR